MEVVKKEKEGRVTYIIVGMVVRRSEIVEESRAALECMEDGMVIKWVRTEYLEPIGITTNPVQKLFIPWGRTKSEHTSE